MIRRLLSCLVMAAFVAGAWAQTAVPPSQALIYYAGQPGRLTQDRDRLGGNPFASAVVEVLGKRPATLTEFTERLAAAKRRIRQLEIERFETTLVFDASAEAARKAMADFSVASESADASVVYIGGHGMQHKRMVYWLMGDYPEQDEKWLPTHAIAIDEIGRVGRARDVNLVLYASCRDDPFQ